MAESTGSYRSITSAKDRLNDVLSHFRSKRHKVVVSRDLGPEVMPILRDRPDFDVVVWPEDRACDRSWLLENIPGASGVLVMLTDKVNDELLSAAGNSLRVVSTMSVGYDHVHLDALASRGVRLGTTPDVLTDAVADLSVMLALMAGRNSKIAAAIVDKGEWPQWTWSPFALCGPQLSANQINPKRTVGFVGFGRIAQATLARLVPFGMTDCLYAVRSSSRPDPARDADLLAQLRLHTLKRASLEEVASNSDVVFVLAPGGAETRHIINEQFLRKMKKTSVLVNTSRGTLVDSEALARALREGWIWGAGLDVVEGEPNVSLDHPLVKEPRCVVLPHIASATTETRLGMATLAAQNLVAGVVGEAMPSEVQLTK